MAAARSVLEGCSLTPTLSLKAIDKGGGMVTGVEKAISRLLRSVMANLSTGELIPDSKDFQELLM